MALFDLLPRQRKAQGKNTGSQSQPLGTLRKGEQVEVIGKENGFAIINYRNHRAYVSLRYLSKD